MIEHPLLELRTAIEELTRENLEQKKNEVLNYLSTVSALIPAGNGDGVHHKLSPREREVMKMILDGQRLKEIAAALDISVKTVTTHRSRLLRKLGLEDNLGLYRYGIRHGIIGI